MPEPSQEREQFLRTLWPSLPEGHWLLLWGAPSKKSEWISDKAYAAIPGACAQSIGPWSNRENVYVGCATRTHSYGPTERGKKEDCAAIPGLWLDIDYGTEHKKPNLPVTEEDAKELIISMGLPATMVVHSGRGLQAWWCFKEPWVFESDEERDKAERLTKAWCSTLRAKCLEKGWDADQVGDLPRVMRLPGTWNRKGIPIPTKLLMCDEFNRYNPSDFEPLLAGEPKEPENRPTIEWKFELNPNAEPPASKFMMLCEADSDFRLGWLEKLSFQDRSASAFDLSQATRAYASNWSAQEIVNLLIARRRERGHDLKLRHKYYADTLTKAASGRADETRRQLVEDIRAGQPLPEEIRKDPAEVLAICSRLIGVTISKFVRFRGEPNTYQITVKGQLINVDNVEMLGVQSRFKNLILDHTDHLFHKMDDDGWTHFVNTFFSAVENVQLSADATMKGAYENWIELYLSDVPLSESEWQNKALNGSPFIKDGKTYIVSEGFRQFIWGSQQEKVSARQLTAALTKCGYKNEHLNFRYKNKQNKRSVWVVNHG